MKKLLSAIVLGFAIFWAGSSIGQVKSQFPKPSKQDAVAVEFANCEDVLVSITSFTKDNDLRYVIYEVGDTIFAIVEFGPKSDQAIAIYLLRPDKTVYKFVPIEFGKIESPCETVKSLKLKNERTTF